jgi:hypothetical protein
VMRLSSDNEGMQQSRRDKRGRVWNWVYSFRINLPKRHFECHPRDMKRECLRYAIVGAVLVCGTLAVAQEKGNWRAANSTAQSITGDVTLSDEKISINYSGFAIARIRGLEPGEVSAAFEADSGAGGSGSLYRLSIPSSKRFIHRNTLCGSEDTQWMATYVAGHSLHLAFFSGPKMPIFTSDAISNSTDLCGTFSYVR